MSRGVIDVEGEAVPCINPPEGQAYSSFELKRMLFEMG